LKARIEAAKERYYQKFNMEIIPPERRKEIEGMIERLERINASSESYEQRVQEFCKRADEYSKSVDKLTIGPNSYKAKLNRCLQKSDECIEAMNEYLKTRQNYMIDDFGNESQSEPAGTTKNEGVLLE
jgi:uncharacterized coiled-coil DUF342 family protein